MLVIWSVQLYTSIANLARETAGGKAELTKNKKVQQHIQLLQSVLFLEIRLRRVCIIEERYDFTIIEGSQLIP